MVELKGLKPEEVYVKINIIVWCFLQNGKKREIFYGHNIFVVTMRVSTLTLNINERYKGLDWDGSLQLLCLKQLIIFEHCNETNAF